MEAQREAEDVQVEVGKQAAFGRGPGSVLRVLLLWPGMLVPDPGQGTGFQNELCGGSCHAGRAAWQR